MPDDRPDYVPRLWARNSVNRWFWSDPRRMFWRLLALPVMITAVGVLALTGHDWVPGIVAATAGVLSAFQPAIYGPRALRATRRERMKP